ncbi:hypothetical protein [Agromyces italicus]|uniref:hypothetical protein n=1 Tax=Agromyces italicus TaxID=279572 RepID=UPI0003B3324F|nr:hypothetical protein [Agromyces italicus]
MLVSEYSFPHLIAAGDERRARELERRRVADERRAELATPARTRRAASRRSIRRTADRTVAGDCATA